MNDVTRILSAIESGDPRATAQLLPLVYDELRRLAAHRIAREKPGQTLQATALVHEAYLRLIGPDQARNWDGRAHFFAAAAESMRRILVDNARRKLCLKHGAGLVGPFEEHDVASPARPEALLALDEALDRLATTSPEVAELIKLRSFAGCTNAEAATLLAISPRKANQLWAYGRAWLREELGEDGRG